MDVEGLLLPDSPRMEPELPEGLDLQTFQTVQQCTAGLPHSCEVYWSTISEEERKQLCKWFRKCEAQLQGEKPRPDIEREEDGSYNLQHSCSFLKELRKVSAKQRPVASPPACLQAATQEDQDQRRPPKEINTV